MPRHELTTDTPPYNFEELSDIWRRVTRKMSKKSNTSWKDAPVREQIYRVKTKGVDLLRDPRLNKGLAFNLQERQIIGVHGLLPPAIFSSDQQVAHTMTNLHHFKADIDKYVFLMGLQDRNEKLFYRVLTQHTEELMPIVYTPTVGLACQKYGSVFRRPRGLFITIHDAGHIYQILGHWPEEMIKAIVVTDGERILGLGDLGCYGQGIPVGKLALYSALAGINPQHCLPVMIDVGTNNQTLLDDPLYIGIKQSRVKGQAYDDLIDEFMQAVVRRYGRKTLIQFEDFGNSNAFRFLQKYRDEYCTFNDDIQGTAAVAVAGVLASLRITGKKLSENTFFFQGAGEAALGIASLIVLAMTEQGLDETEALSKIWLFDSRGLVVKSRGADTITEHKKRFVQDFQHLTSLEEAVKAVRPSVLIGAAAQPGVFTEQVIRDMSSFNERPVIFALSNPTSKAECTAEQCYTFSKGKAIFASGSPFSPVTVNGETLVPGQGNNAYIFPGIALAVIACKVRHITDDVFLKSAQALADLVTQEHLKQGRVYPPLTDILDVSTTIAVKLAEYVYENKMAAFYPEPSDKAEFIKWHQYSTDYECFVPDMYEYPSEIQATNCKL